MSFLTSLSKEDISSDHLSDILKSKCLRYFFCNDEKIINTGQNGNPGTIPNILMDILKPEKMVKGSI